MAVRKNVKKQGAPREGTGIVIEAAEPDPNDSKTPTAARKTSEVQTQSAPGEHLADEAEFTSGECVVKMTRKRPSGKT